jgi:hypothetical protein
MIPSDITCHQACAEQGYGAKKCFDHVRR